MLAFLVLHSQRSIGEEYVRDGRTLGYTEKEVSDLKLKLENTKFPQKDGYVQSLLKNDAGVGMLVCTADLLPNEEGILATYTFTYSLSGDYTLIVHQDHYGEGKSPLKTDIVDSNAEIVRYKAQEVKKQAEAGADQPATVPQLKSESGQKSQPKSEVRPR